VFSGRNRARSWSESGPFVIQMTCKRGRFDPFSDTKNKPKDLSPRIFGLASLQCGEDCRTANRQSLRLFFKELFIHCQRATSQTLRLWRERILHSQFSVINSLGQIPKYEELSTFQFWPNFPDMRDVRDIRGTPSMLCQCERPIFTGCFLEM
jgi:hypothetical protein